MNFLNLIIKLRNNFVFFILVWNGAGRQCSHVSYHCLQLDYWYSYIWKDHRSSGEFKHAGEFHRLVIAIYSQPDAVLDKPVVLQIFSEHASSIHFTSIF